MSTITEAPQSEKTALLLCVEAEKTALHAQEEALNAQVALATDTAERRMLLYWIIRVLERLEVLERRERHRPLR